MTIFERVIPFPERVRWLMLKTALDTNTDAATIAKRLDWPLYRVNRIVMAVSPTVYIRDIAEWFHAIGEDTYHLKFELIK